MRYTFGKDELDLHGAAGGWLPSGKVGLRWTSETTSGDKAKILCQNMIKADENNPEIIIRWNLLKYFSYHVCFCIFRINDINVNYRCQKIGRVIFDI